MQTRLLEDLRDDLGVEAVLDERGVEECEDAEELVQRLLRVHVRGGVEVAVAARGQPRSAVEWGYLIADVINLKTFLVSYQNFAFYPI